MRNILLIARREYLEQIRGRAFKFSTVLMPLLIVAFLGVSYFTGRNVATGKHIAISADNASLADMVRREMLYDTSAKFTVDVIAPAAADDRAVLLRELHARSLNGILDLHRSAQGYVSATYTTLSADEFSGIGNLQNYLNRAVLKQRLIDAKMKPDQFAAVTKWVPIEVRQLNKAGNVSKNSGMASLYKAFAMAFLLTMPILLYGMDMARSVVEEKNSRIFEVMLAVTRPDDLLTGKLIGVGAVAFTQILIWAAAAAVLLGSSLAASLLSGKFPIHFTWLEGIFFPVYFVLGFFLYSAFFSGLASTCETAQELQMYMPLAAVPVWISFGIIPFLLNNPGSKWAVAASLFPPTAPFVMLPRMGLETPPFWQFAVSIGLLVLAIWAVLRFSSRLYRVGILMYGKRATLPEILRWLRYS